MWSRESDSAAVRVFFFGRLFIFWNVWFSFGIRRLWVGNVGGVVNGLYLGFCLKVHIWAPDLELGFTV